MGIFDKFRKPDIDKLMSNADVNGLVKALNYDKAFIRARAAKALGIIKDDRAIESLITALNDQSNEVQVNAAIALKHFDTTKINKIISKVEKILQEYQENQNKMIESLSSALRDDNLHSRIEGAKALGAIKSSNSARLLIRSISNEALMPFMIINKTVIPTAQARAQENGEGNYMAIVSTIAKVLGEMGEAAVEPLIDALKDNSARVRGIATYALKNCYLDINETSSAKAVTALEYVMENEQEDLIIRLSAAFALDKLTGKYSSKDDLVSIDFIKKSKNPKLTALIALNLRKELNKGNLSAFEKLEQGLTSNKMDEALNILSHYIGEN